MSVYSLAIDCIDYCSSRVLQDRLRERERWGGGGETDRQTDRQADRQTDRQTDRQSE